jgi:hypothetical protein
MDAPIHNSGDRSMSNARKLLALVCALACIGAADAPHITGQLLAYQDGYVFFTNGNGFKVATSVKILDDATKATSTRQPRPRAFARAIFNDAGEVVEIDLAAKAFPLEPLNPLVESYVVAASAKTANPDLTKGGPVTRNGVPITFSGKPVLVTFNVLVPPTTPLNAQVYIATDQSSWNPQALQMDRVDALHFRATRTLASGTILHYVYTRGSLQSAERAQNGLDRDPRDLVVNDADVRTVNEVVYQWADQSPTNGSIIQPNVVPTPYNPAPFPNLPSSIPTPHPG